MRIFVYIGLLWACGASASEPMIFHGVDIAPAVAYFGTQVHPLTHSIFTYHWEASGLSAEWAKEHAPDDPYLMTRTQQAADTYWIEYDKHHSSTGNMYGYGLYLSSDAVATRSYGGSNDMFLLIELEFPKNFRLLDLTQGAEDPTGALSAGALKVMAAFNCSTNLDANTFFMDGGSMVPPSCVPLVEEIFKNRLKIDGFSYAYGDTQFPQCAPYMGQKAFVITSTAWLTPSLQHYYTPNSRGNPEGRRRIQTLFLEASPSLGVSKQLVLQNLQDALLQREGTFVAGSSAACKGEFCEMSVNLCDEAKHCETVGLGAIPRPAGSTIHASPSVPLLWADLEGQPKTDSISAWLKSNKFGCSGTMPYAQTPGAKP